MSGESIQWQNRALRLALGLGMALGLMVFNGTIILFLRGLGPNLLAPLPIAMFALLSASFYIVVAETDLAAIIRGSNFLRWEARVVYSTLYLDTIVLFGAFNGLGPNRNSIIEALLAISSFLAVFFFVRLCVAEHQTTGNLTSR